MNIITRSESLTLLASLSGTLPFLAPAKTVITLISQALDAAEDNRNQCRYLLQRSADICLQIDQLCKTRNQRLQAPEHLNQFLNALEGIRVFVRQIAEKTPLQRFLQRHDISDGVANAHRSLNQCVELFQLQSAVSMGFDVAEFEEARQRDQYQLTTTLERILESGENMSGALELRNDQILEAIHGLYNHMRKGIDDAVQRQFAEASLQSLMERHAATSLTPITYHDWAVSSLEIFHEGEVLGEGSFGTVYTGRWQGCRVAVKHLALSISRQELINEIEIWRQLQHPHIASFFGACIDSHPRLLIAELYRFGNAIHYLAQFPDADRLRMCHEISLGMQYLHSKRVIHGDLKPLNVLIDDAHRARIADFSLSTIKASLTASTTTNASISTLPKIQGTKVFMAPERLERGTMNFGTDVYAFSMTAYQIFTGQAPFQHLPEDELYRAVREGIRPERPQAGAWHRGLTNNVWKLLKKCWTPEHRSRPKFERISQEMEICMRQRPSPDSAPARSVVPRPSQRSLHIMSLTHDSQLQELIDYEALFESATEDVPDTRSTSGTHVYTPSGSPSRSRETIVWNPPVPDPVAPAAPQADVDTYDIPGFPEFQLPPLSIETTPSPNPSDPKPPTPKETRWFTSGRGGLGNLKAVPANEVLPGSTVPVEPESSIRSSGRGGLGNMRPSPKASRTSSDSGQSQFRRSGV